MHLVTRLQLGSSRVAGKVTLPCKLHYCQMYLSRYNIESNFPRAFKESSSSRSNDKDSLMQCVPNFFNSRTIRSFRTLFAYHLHLENLIAQKYTVAIFLLTSISPELKKTKK